MASLLSVRRRLHRTFGPAVEARLQDKVLTLTGQLDRWEQVVQAGRLCVCPARWTVVNHITCPAAPEPPMHLPAVQDTLLEGRSFDVAVIGAGVVGCAIARELRRWDIRVALIEKEHDVALQASSRNDGMVHPGIDLKPGSLKHKYNQLGNRMYPMVCKQLGVPFKRTGQILCMGQPWAPKVMPLLPAYWNHILRVPCQYLTREEVLRREPGLTEDVQCGLLYPTAGIVCPYGLTIAYAENAVDNGAELFLDTAVTGMEVEKGQIRSILTNRGRFAAKVVVNAAGVFSDKIAAMAGDEFFTIHARKGTNSILDKKAARQVRTIASMLGTQDTKGAHTKGGGIVSTVDGNLLVGPDAVETNDREDTSTRRESVETTFRKQGVVLPTLSGGDIITYFSGVRAPTYEEDFVICKGHATHNLVHAAGIQSPGLTAAPAIGLDVARMAVELLGGAARNRKFDPIRKPIPRTAALPDDQRQALIERDPDWGVIVCRCEEVSRGEILAALRRSVPCDTVDGVKRRVRPGMGRCQGGFCGPVVAQMIAEEKHLPLEQVLKSGTGSWIVCRDTKEGGGAE